MTVLRGAARRIALGLALAAAVSLIPVRSAAADPAGAQVRAADLWQAALQWLAEVWKDALPEGEGAGEAVAGCRDEGMCIDPNG